MAEPGPRAAPQGRPAWRGLWLLIGSPASHGEGSRRSRRAPIGGGEGEGTRADVGPSAGAAAGFRPCAAAGAGQGHGRGLLGGAAGAAAQGRAAARVGPRAAAERGHGPGGAQHRLRAGGGGREPRRGRRRLRLLRVQPVSVRPRGRPAGGLGPGRPVQACPDVPSPQVSLQLRRGHAAGHAGAQVSGGQRGGGRPGAAPVLAHPTRPHLAPQAEDLPPGQHLPQPGGLGQRRWAAR